MQKYASSSNNDAEQDKAILEEITELALEVSKYPKLKIKKYEMSKISSTYLNLSNSVENTTELHFRDSIQDILNSQRNRFHYIQHFDHYDSSKEDEHDQNIHESKNEDEKPDQITELTDQMNEFIDMRYSIN